jgi:4-oxalocrotonate tautomerase
MPYVQISMIAGRTDDQKETLLRAVHNAVEESLGVPPEAIRVWISEFGMNEFISGGKTAADRAAERAAVAS